MSLSRVRFDLARRAAVLVLALAPLAGCTSEGPVKPQTNVAEVQVDSGGSKGNIASLS